MCCCFVEGWLFDGRCVFVVVCWLTLLVFVVCLCVLVCCLVFVGCYLRLVVGGWCVFVVL